MRKVIELFMWGYQPHFRSQMEHRARDVLEMIAPTLQPRTFLVGIRTTEKTEGHPVCVEPEDEDWNPRIFFGCAARAEEIYKEHPDHSIIYGDAPRMRDKPENIRKKSVLEAVREVTLEYDFQFDTSTFCGWPTRVEGYHVVPVLQFHKSHLMEYPRLDEPIRFQEWTSSSSFLESVIETLIEEATNALEAKEPGRFFDTFRIDASALLRDAGDRFCGAISLITRDVMLQNVFNALNVVSSMPYEGAEAIGSLIFAHKENEAVEIRVRFNEPVQLHDYKLARKIIEMSSEELCCVCSNSKGIHGLGEIRSEEATGYFKVVFSGHYEWELYYEKTPLMRSDYGVPKLPSLRLKAEEFTSIARRILTGLDEGAKKRLWSIVEAAMEQRHGTMIVVSDKAEEEAERLCKQSLGIAPIELNPGLVRRLSGIDGALLINSNGTCYAVGVILDGMATKEGDPSRGARFNSAIRYIKSVESPTICIVVSEDGYVNLLPNLRPRVSRKEIEEKIALLETQNIENYHKTRNWLDKHRFYLNAEQCKTVNEELARINSAPMEVGEIRIVTPPFEPNPDMNDSYYLEE